MPRGIYIRNHPVWNKGISIDRNKYPKFGHFKDHTPEAKLKMKENHKGNTGKKFTQEHKDRISSAQKGRKLPKGEEARNWRGGRRKYLTKCVLVRDDYTCTICGLKDPEIMEVDHIKEFSLGGQNSLENLQTLCPNCHERKTRKFRRLKRKRVE